MKRLMFFILGIGSFLFLFITPQKTFALECNSVSGKFIDAKTNQTVENVGWMLKIDGKLSDLYISKDGNFIYNQYVNASTVLLMTNRAKYFPLEINLTQCNQNIVKISPLGDNPNPRCGYICKNDAYCDEGSDNCKLCVEVEPGIRRCTDPSWGGGTYNLCQGNQECTNCLGGGNSWTALGCLKTSNSQDFVAWILKFAIGIGGGIAFLLIIWGGFQIILSAGNPEKVKAGKEIITAAIAGLLLIIFSVFILRLIGYDIIGIPGFTQIQTGGGGPVHLVK